MHDVMTLDFARIAQDLQIRKVQVESVVQLLDEGNTVPFITRYRKERTGGLNEEVIRQVQARVGLLRQLGERKQTILKSIEGQGKLTDELRAAILGAETSKRLEDLYLPYKPKKRTLASVARERGLEPLALAIKNADPAVAKLDEVLPTLVNPEKELPTPAEVLAGVQHILAEQIAETADIRATIRGILWDTGRLATRKSETLSEGQGVEYKDYFDFTEPVRQIPPHRILAINRGEKEGSLKVRLEWNTEAVEQALFARLHGRPPLLPLENHPHAAILHTTAEDALSRLLIPSLERELRRELTERSEGHAVGIFARNLRCLLLQPPLHNRRVLAIDPGFRTGCKVAALDEVGNLLEDAVIFPHPLLNKSQNKKASGNPLPTSPTMGSEGPTHPLAPAATEPPGQPIVQNAIDSGASPQAKPEEPAPQPPSKIEDFSQAKIKKAEAKVKLEKVVRKFQINVIAIGNGTACRETEEFISEFIADLDKKRLENEHAPIPESITSECAHLQPLSVSNQPEERKQSEEIQGSTRTIPTGELANTDLSLTNSPNANAKEDEPKQIEGSPFEKIDSTSEVFGPIPELAYVIVNEAGASVYSASPIGREEFPNYDATLRGTISIGRRLQDPLSELVKIDPQSIGVGLYQHDVNPRQLKECLDSVIESSVNHVGVDLNTASVPLLRHVSGLNQLAARELVDYRKNHGPFKNREQLLQVPGIGPVRYIQAAGFLKILGGDNPLDMTWIHPESYRAAQQLLGELGYEPKALEDRQKATELRDKLKTLPSEEISTRLEVGVPTIRDIIDALARPGRDPREDLPQPIFKKGILKLDDLQQGMELKGTVLNVVDFGAFVDIGLKDSGLVHISQMANRYIKSPYDVVSVSDVVTVWVLNVDKERRRVSLTMIKPGTERRPQEKTKPPSRPQQRGARPPRGRRPGAIAGQPAAIASVATVHPSPTPTSEPVTLPVSHEAPSPAATIQPKGPVPGRPLPPPRKPHRQLPKPKLSQAALEGEAPLRTFSELKAFFEAKHKEGPPLTQEHVTRDQGSGTPGN